MANKTLRILIADSRHFQTLLVERMLNRLGYYRIATASSIEEACILGHCTGTPFDLLIASARLLPTEATDSARLSGVCLNGLVYQSQYLPESFMPLVTEGAVSHLQGALDSTSLAMFMALIDPQAAPYREQHPTLHP